MKYLIMILLVTTALADHDRRRRTNYGMYSGEDHQGQSGRYGNFVGQDSTASSMRDLPRSVREACRIATGNERQYVGDCRASTLDFTSIDEKYQMALILQCGDEENNEGVALCVEQELDAFSRKLRDIDQNSDQEQAIYDACEIASTPLAGRYAGITGETSMISCARTAVTYSNTSRDILRCAASFNTFSNIESCMRRRGEEPPREIRGPFHSFRRSACNGPLAFALCPE